MKIVTIVENDCITGVRYGVKEIPEPRRLSNTITRHTITIVLWHHVPHALRAFVQKSKRTSKL